MLKLLDFHQTNCAPCRMMEGPLNELAEKYQGKVEVVKLNIEHEENIQFIEEYGIMRTPTFVLKDEDKVLNRESGYLPFEVLEAFLLEYMEEEEK